MKSNITILQGHAPLRLKDVPDKDVFNWYTAYEKYPDVKYPAPMVDFHKRKDEWYKLTKR